MCDSRLYCPWCQSELKRTGRRGPMKTYCNSDCRELYFYYGMSKTEASKGRTGCKVCGKQTALLKKSGLPKKYCNSECHSKGAYLSREIKKKHNKQCLHCGKAFETWRSDCLFCSRACLARFRYDHPKGKECKCQYCGCLFIPRKADRTTYCSVQCGAKVNGSRKQMAHSLRTGRRSNVSYCSVCGIVLRGKGRVACKEHQRQVQLEQGRLDYYSNRECDSGYVTCKECGQTVYKDQRASVTKYCSYACSVRALKRETGNHRKRARINGVEYDKTVRLSMLMVRDGGRCQVCGHKVTRTKKHTKRRATLGHLKAMSKGGSHTWDNVQLECWECNTYIGDTEHGQRRLSF